MYLSFSFLEWNVAMSCSMKTGFDLSYVRFCRICLMHIVVGIKLLVFILTQLVFSTMLSAGHVDGIAVLVLMGFGRIVKVCYFPTVKLDLHLN